MDIEFEHLENEAASEKIRLYLERVEQLYTLIKQPGKAGKHNH
jgi:hypothetical protein